MRQPSGFGILQSLQVFLLEIFWVFRFVLGPHHKDMFAQQWQDFLPLQQPGHPVVKPNLRHLACSAQSTNKGWGGRPGWADSCLPAIFTPGLRFLKSNRVTVSGPGEKTRERCFSVSPKGTSTINIQLTILWFANKGCQRMREEDAGSRSVLELF